MNGIGGTLPPIVITNKASLNEFEGIRFEQGTNDGLQNSDKLVYIIGSEIAGIKPERNSIIELMSEGSDVPLIVKKKYDCPMEELVVRASADFGSLLADGLIDGLWIDAPQINDPSKIEELSLGILQATGAKISKAEFISCPSCGRTTYDIQKSLKDIKARTSHLKGLKIGVMGCIVNGPGEMADAHYGYVGAGKGKITLYKGKLLVRKNIAEEFAVDALIELIKSNGDWQEQ